MKLNTLLCSFVVCFLFAAVVYAKIIDAHDLDVSITSAVNLSFKQEDQIKPLIKDYAAKIQQAYDEAGGNSKAIQSYVSLLNYNLQKQMVSILTTEQVKKWDEAKKSLLPQQGQ